MSTIEDYIRKAAAARGIDPDIAVRVAMSEGGLDDPVRQSGVVKNGRREPSYGPFQLYFGGGLGNEALKAGIDARNPNDWQGGVDFALDHARKNGWGSWYGAKRVGIGNMDGIGGRSGASAEYGDPSSTLKSGASAQYGINLNTTPLAAAPSSDVAAPAASQSPLQKLLGGGDALGAIAGALGGGGGSSDPSANQIAPSSIGMETGSAAASQAATLMATLMAERRKRYGLSLNSVGL